MPLKPTCKEVHQLASESMDRELTMVERTRMRMHLLVCDGCRNFSEQMDLIRKAMRRMAPDKEKGDDSF